MRQILAALLALAPAACVGAPDPGALTGCPPPGWDRDRLAGLKASGFEIADADARQAFAQQIVACLASPDPVMRDGIAYEALSKMLRAGQLSDATKRSLMADLGALLEGPEGAGFARPFAALALSEVARADRIEPFLDADQRARLLAASLRWFAEISDYRGFSDGEGWRHGVAHGADLLMQLALNPELETQELRQIVSAIGAKVAPVGVSYVYGESERLARPVLVAAARGAMTPDAWTLWLASIAEAPRNVKIFESETGLAWRHDTLAFLNALYVNVTLGSDKADDVMLPGLEAALKAMP